MKNLLMKNKIIIGILFAFALLIIAGCANNNTANNAAGNTANANQIVKVGVIMPMSGDVAAFGNNVINGIKIAEKEMNLQNVQLIYEDGKCNAKDSVNAMNKLVQVDKVSAVIGELCSAATLPNAPIANQYQIILLSPTASAPKIKDAGDYVFRTIPSDENQGKFAAKLLEKRGHKSLAILNTNEDYGLGLGAVLQQSFEADGNKVTAVEKFNSGTTDLRTQLLKIKETNPDAIFIASNSIDSSVAIFKQIKELGITAKLFGSEALYGQSYIDGAKDAIEGLEVTTLTTGSSDFKQKYMAAYGKDAEPFSPFGYDAYKAIGLAIQQGARTGTEIKDKLYQEQFQGATGLIKFDSYGEVSGEYLVYKVVNQKYILQEN